MDVVMFWTVCGRSVQKIQVDPIPMMSSEYSQTNKVEEVVSSGNEKITLKLIDQDGTVLELRVRKGVSFRKILDAFAQNMGKEAGELRLLLSGKVVNLGQTPYDLALDGNEELEVVASQTGGTQAQESL